MWRRVIGAIALFMLCSSMAQAQRSPGGTVGVFKPGDVGKIQGNGLTTSAGDVQGDTAGKGVNPFAILDRNDKGLCIRNGTSGSAHTAFCFGHDAQGNALISIDNLGGSVAKQLMCSINGTVGPCFSTTTTGGGTGGGVTPGSHLALSGGGVLLLSGGGALLLN